MTKLYRQTVTNYARHLAITRYVDDMTLSARGCRHTISEVLSADTGLVMAGLQDDLGMIVSV